MKSDMAAVSAVGENMAEALPAVGAAMSELTKKVYMMTTSSEDLSVTYVVDEADATAVVEGLHNVLLGGKSAKVVDESVFGGSWDELKTEFLKVEAR